MKNYRITVNGNTYDVQVEEVSGGAAPAASVQNTAPAPAAALAQAASPAPAPAAAPAAAAGSGQSVTSPMPGSILDIKVGVGDKVSANQVVIVLEAMKMENEIVTPVAGTVTSVTVTKGQQVASGDVLVTVAE